MRQEIRKGIILLSVLMSFAVSGWLLWQYAVVHLSREPEQTTSASLETTLSASEPSVPETTAAQTLPPETTSEPTVPVETEPPKVTIDTVPQYFQNDYPDEPYGTGTVATSGSSMTALAMVASFLTDNVYTPDQMADYLAHFMGGNYKRLEYGNDLLQLCWKRAGNIHESVQAVRDGKTVIIMLAGENLFSWKEHYVVLTGVTGEDRFLVLDTDAENYEKDWLEDCYRNGFSWKDFLRGYSCGWIYDKSAMPEEPYIYLPEPPADTPRYPDLTLTAEEKMLIANLICMEAGSEPFEGQQAVAEVILNRLASGRFQSSIHNIIHAPEQFASVSRLHEAKPDYSQYKAIEQALYGPYVLPEDVVFFAKFKVNDNYWGQIGSHYFCYNY